MKNFLLIAAFITCSLVSCDGTHYVVGAQLSAPAYSRPVAPGDDYVWIDGDWIVENGNYIWHEGYWDRPRVNRVWEAGHWQGRNNGWYWRRGRWH